mgnify:CR=1 FL=1
MKIGLVLSSTPAYSETFFNSKIKGLLENGFEVLLFVQHKQANFSLCKVVESPKIYKNAIFQFFAIIYEFILLVPYFKAVSKFLILEHSQKTSIINCIKKTYLNADLLKQQLDWLHFGFATMAIGKEYVANSIGAKMAVSFRGFDIAIYPLKNPNCYELLFKQVTRAHTISNDLLQRAYELGLDNKTPVAKITPAIDTNIFKPFFNKNFANETKQFLTVTRLHWKKGIVLMLEALAIVKSKGHKFKYTIVGTGTDYEFERIKFAILQFNLTNEVNLVGIRNREEVLEYYNKATIYLQYSISEGFCNAVLEAQAMGLLCVVSDAEGLPENIEDNVSGWVVLKLNAPALASKIIEVYSLGEIEKMNTSNNARKRVIDNFSLNDQNEKFKQFYCND